MISRVWSASMYWFVALEICIAVHTATGQPTLQNCTENQIFVLQPEPIINSMDAINPFHGRDFDHDELVMVDRLDEDQQIETHDSPWDPLVEYMRSIYKYVDLPRRNISAIVDVHFAFYILSIEDIIERDETLLSYGWITLDWRDDFLRWNASKFDGITKLSSLFRQESSNKPIDLWTPTIISHNKKLVMRSADHLLSPENFLAPDVHHNGRIHLESVGVIATHCELHMRNFPFDKQTCYLTFGSTERVRLLCTTKDEMFNNMTLERLLGNNHWRLESASCEEKDTPFYRNNEIVIQFRLSRKPEFYVNLIVAPCAVIALLGVLVFVLPTDSGEKVSLGITLLLSFIVFLTIISDRMPQSSDETPLLTLYLLVSMCLSALSLFATVIVQNISSNGLPNCTPKPKHDTARGHYNQSASSEPAFNQHSGDPLNRMERNTDSCYDGIPMDISSKTNQGKSAAEVTQECVQRQETLVRSVAERAAEVRRRKHVDERWLRFGRRLDRVLLVLFLLATVGTLAIFMGVCPFTEC